MRYFGFDLGDGESCVALYSDQHIAPVILPVHGRNSFITALARYDGHPVVGALASDNPQAEDLRVCFKRNFRTNSDFVNQTVAAFAKGVLTALQDHSVVRHIMETEDVSFIVGCPADWGGQRPHAICSLLMAAGLPNVRIVPESRAAFLSASTAEEDETLRRALMDCALVIDLGSSTMDLAYVCDGREYAVSTMGVQLGGGMLDELLLEQAVDALCAEEAELVREILREKSAWKSRMMLSARRLKEQFFTLGTGEELTRRETIFCEGRHVLNLTISAAIVEELCERPSPLLEGESFRSRMMNCLLMAQQMTAQRPPKVVLLTGGASRMTFFQQLCRETFPDSMLHVSATPEFDIARGIGVRGACGRNGQAAEGGCRGICGKRCGGAEGAVRYARADSAAFRRYGASTDGQRARAGIPKVAAGRNGNTGRHGRCVPEAGGIAADVTGMERSAVRSGLAVAGQHSDGRAA